MALGVGPPYWAVVAAASIFQSNLALTWRRALNRVFGNLVGLALLAALLPITHTG
ncbi:FUSC family protein [Streptomyces sp. LN590]|uniref:FUSC family protein n=1 Tax=unclassified Streptomyces TaxID=2593676 RepID=UPI00371C5D73